MQNSDGIVQKVLFVFANYPHQLPLTQGERRMREGAKILQCSVSYPSCKGEVEGVVKASALYGWNLKS